MKNITTLEKALRISRSAVLTALLFAATALQGVMGQVSTYSYTTAAGTYTAVTGTSIMGNVDDGNSAATNIGFSFNMGGTNYTQFRANSNGHIRLGGVGTTSNYLPLSTTTNTGAIAAVGRDGKSTGGVAYALQGTAPSRIAVIQYTNYDLVYNATTRRVSFQIRLYETSNIVEIIYNGAVGTTATLTSQVGLRGGTAAADFRNCSGSIPQWNGLAAGAANNNTVRWGSSQNATRSMPSNGRILRWTPPVVCSGTPAGGTAADANVCPNASTTLTVTGAETGTGITYAWEQWNGSSWVSAAGGSGATTTAYTTPSITTAMQYRLTTTCTNSGQSSSTGGINVTPVMSVACYCVPTATNDDATGLTNVTFNTINNSSTGNPAYTNFTAQSTTVVQGTAYNLSTRVNTAGAYTVHVRACIDWNQNGTFEVGEQYDLGSANSVTDAATSLSPYTITVPGAAALGTTYMRVRAVYNTAVINACGNQNYSEAEDYTIVVTAPSVCSGLPAAGTPPANSNLCPNASTTLTVTGVEIGTGITYQWEEWNGSSWVNAAGGSGATTTAYTTPNLSSTMQYRLTTTCTNSAQSSSTTGITLTQTFTAACYCPVSITNNDPTGITQVNFNTISNTSIGNPAVTDFTAISTTVQRGVSYPLSVRVNTDGAWTVNARAWIDWNQNGVFEAGEEYNLGSAYNVASGLTNLSPNVAVPMDAVLGTTYMRVAGIENSNPTPLACGNPMLYGEYEMYTINVDPAPTCLAPTAPVASAITSNGATVSWTAPLPGPSNGYEWEVRTTGAGGSGGAGLTTNGSTAAGVTTASATGLSANTVYNLYVRSDCGSSLYSTWAGPFTFLTPTTIAALPLASTALTCTGAAVPGVLNASSVPAVCGAASNNYKGGQEALYIFTPASTGGITISYTGQTYTGIFLYSGDYPGTVGSTCVGSASSTSSTNSLSANVTAGTTYYLWFDTWPAPNSPCPGTMTITAPMPPPANDDCGGAISIGPIPTDGSCVNQNVNTAFATQSPQALCGGTPDDDVWYSFTVPTGQTQVNYSTSNISGSTDRRFQLFDACGGTSLFCLDPESGSFTGLSAGSTYLLRVYTSAGSGAVSNFTLCLSVPPLPPVNNLCADALPVVCGGTYNGNTAAANNVGNGPTCTTTASTAPGVWYTFTGNGQFVTASLCGSAFDTKLFVYTGSCGSFTCVAGNDDDCGAQSRVGFSSQVGTTYYILVAGFGTASGTFTLSMTCAADPCSSVSGTGVCGSPINTVISAGTGVWPGFYDCTFLLLALEGRERLYSYTPTVTSTYYSVSVNSVTPGGGGNFIDIMYKANTCSNGGWTCLLDVNGASTSGTFTMTAGTTYYFLVKPELTTGYTVNWQINCPPPVPVNDMCSNATALPCGTNALAGTTVGTLPEASWTTCGVSSYGVWYTFLGNGYSTTISSTATFDHEMVMTSGVCGSLNLLASPCVDNFGSGGTETYTFTTVLNQTYYVFIGHFSSSSTVTGTFTITRTCAVNEWTGNAMNNDWATNGNWSTGTAPVAGGTAFIPTTPTGSNFPIIDEAAQIETLIIRPGASISIQSGHSMTVTGVLTNNGIMNVASGGSLVQTATSTLAGTGTYNVTRAGNPIFYVYDYWSSPINSASAPPVSLLGATVYQFNPSTGTADPADDAFDPGWVAASGNMAVGRGYAAAGAGTRTFTGTVNNGQTDATVAYYSNPTPTLGGVPYNLIGNPYPSAVDVGQFLTLNSSKLATGTVYLWDDPGTANYVTGDYAQLNNATYTAGGGGTPSQGLRIGSHQGFKVEVNATATGGAAFLRFTNDMRTATNTSVLFRQSDNKLLWLSTVSANSNYNQLAVGFFEDGTDGEDWGYDAPKLNSLGVLSFYSYLDGNPYGIQVYGALETDRVVPLGLNSQEQTMVTIALDSTENLTEDVILEDRHLGIFHDLRLSPYVFQSSNVLYNDRFFLRFANGLVTTIRENDALGANIYMNDGFLFLSTTAAFKGTVRVIDMSGRTVWQSTDVNIDPSGRNFDMQQLSRGVYVVALEGETGKFNSKVVR